MSTAPTTEYNFCNPLSLLHLSRFKLSHEKSSHQKNQLQLEINDNNNNNNKNKTLQIITRRVESATKYI